MDVFKDTLSGIRERVEGLLVAAIIDADGIAIDSVGSVPQGNLETLVAEFSAFARSVRISNTELGSGDLQQLAVVTDTTVTLLAALATDYYLVLVLNRNGNFGRARYETVKARAALEPELV